MVLSSCTTRSEERFPPPKYKGIHEPKGRVRGFRVEIRPPGSSSKIWVGTFETRDKAMRAFDAAVYLIGKEPHYFVYPGNYFPARIANLPKEEVQKQAKLLAEKTDDLPTRLTSVHGGHLKTVEPHKASNVVVGEPTNLNTTNDKESLDALVASEFWPAELDDQLHGAPYINLPDELPDSEWISNYFTPSQENSKPDFAPIRKESKAEFAPVQEIEAYFEVSEFLEGCEDVSFIVDSKPPLKVASKRKSDAIEGGGAVANNRKNMGFSEAGGGGAIDGWLSTLFANDPSQFTFFPRVWNSNTCSDDSDAVLVAFC